MEETPAELNPRKGRSLLLFEEGLSKQEKMTNVPQDMR